MTLKVPNLHYINRVPWRSYRPNLTSQILLQYLVSFTRLYILCVCFLLSLKNLPKHLRFCFIPIYLNDCQTDIGRPTIASRQIHWPPLRMRWRMATRKHIPKQIQFNFGSHDAKTYNIAFGCQTILNIIFVILGLVQLVQIFIRSAGIV